MNGIWNRCIDGVTNTPRSLNAVYKKLTALLRKRTETDKQQQRIGYDPSRENGLSGSE